MAFKSIAAKEIETLKNETLAALKDFCSLCVLLKGEVPEGSYIYSLANGNDIEKTAFVAVSKYSKHRWAILTPENITEEQSSIIKHFLDSKVPDEAEIFLFTGRDLSFVDQFRREKNLSMVFQSL